MWACGFEFRLGLTSPGCHQRPDRKMTFAPPACVRTVRTGVRTVRTQHTSPLGIAMGCCWTAWTPPPDAHAPLSGPIAKLNTQWYVLTVHTRVGWEGGGGEDRGGGGGELRCDVERDGLGQLKKGKQKQRACVQPRLCKYSQ